MRGLPGTSRTRPRAGRADRTAAWRVAAVAILLALTAAGLRSRGTFSHAPDRALAGASGAVVATALTVTEGVALVAFVLVLAMARPRRKPKADDDEPPRLPFPWWAKTLAVLAAVAVMVTPLAVLLTRKTRPRTAAPQARAGVLAGGGAPPRLPATAHGSPWPLLAGMLIALALLLALTAWSRRTRRRATGPPRDQARLALGQSLAAGRAALAGPRDPRAAIIACYAAMERGFAAAGSAPAAADTPAEVLARATGAGLVRSGSAARMAGLFRRARYSSEPMTSADSAAAASALDQMQADLGPAGAAP
jgi:LPXTG-motif cell wall-anchored protein